jgi:hypothetical protein
MLPCTKDFTEHDCCIIKLFSQSNAKNKHSSI